MRLATLVFTWWRQNDLFIDGFCLGTFRGGLWLVDTVCRLSGGGRPKALAGQNLAQVLSCGHGF